MTLSEANNHHHHNAASAGPSPSNGRSNGRVGLARPSSPLAFRVFPFKPDPRESLSCVLAQHHDASNVHCFTALHRQHAHFGHRCVSGVAKPWRSKRPIVTWDCDCERRPARWLAGFYDPVLPIPEGVRSRRQGRAGTSPSTFRRREACH